MHIRDVIPADFSETASMSVDAFWDDELYAYTNPLRAQYPNDFRDLFLRRHRLRYWSSGYIFHVAVTDDGDQDHISGGKVVGYAIWSRRGTSDLAKAWRKQTLRGYLESALLQAEVRYATLIGADRSLDPTRLAHFLSEAKEGFTKITEIWKLQNLCVHVDHQRHGIGSRMLDWGKEQAEKERCPIGLESSETARRVYLRSGFRKYGNMHIKGFPIDDVPTFIWEPNGMEGQWGMEEDR
ncbi:hypothetical protein ACLMJK_000020 [Lecanora helva]